MLKTLKNILWLLAGAAIALGVVKVAQESEASSEKWQNAWEKSSTPAVDVL